MLVGLEIEFHKMSVQNFYLKIILCVKFKINKVTQIQKVIFLEFFKTGKFEHFFQQANT